jgi:hypothetical protein
MRNQSMKRMNVSESLVHIVMLNGVRLRALNEEVTNGIYCTDL